MKKIFLFVFVISVLACSLDRSNPLDGTYDLSEPSGIQVQNIDNDFLIISWDRSSYADGYFIYRSEGYDLLYKKIEVIEQQPDSTLSYEDDDVELADNEYWYKLSIYKIVNGDSLEGYRSSPKSWGTGN